MPAAVVFILFVICLIIAIPVSIALTIASVLSGAFDPSFTASGQFVIRSMLGGIDSFPLLAVPMFVLSGILGGIITPRPPATATIAAEKSLSYPSSIRIGIVILPTAATVAGPEPEIAP